MSERGSLIHEPRTLAPLVEKSNLLSFRHNGRIAAVNKLPPVLDSYGVPVRIAMVEQALATIATEHIWSGAYDTHHLAYDGEDYRKVIASDGERVGSNYRGAALLKVVLPRQLHEYLHTIYETPPMPSHDVMTQYGREANCVHNLFNTVRADNYDDHPLLGSLPFDEQEYIRKRQLLSKLESAVEPQVGVVPDHNYLARLSIAESRKILRALARASGYSNAQNCQRVFFSRIKMEA